MNNNKSFYVARALLGIAHKYDKKFFYTIDTNNDIVEGIFYDFNSSKTKYIKCFINKMTNINDTLDEIERCIKEYMNSPEPDFITKNFHIPHKPITRLGDLEKLKINKAMFNDPATIVFWSDGTKTVVKTRGNDKFDPEKGLAMAISKKYMGDEDGLYKEFKKWLPEKEDKILNAALDSYTSSKLKMREDMIDIIAAATEVIDAIDNTLK